MPCDIRWIASRNLFWVSSAPKRKRRSTSECGNSEVLPKSPRATSANPGIVLFSEARNCSARRSALDSTRADRERKKLDPSLVSAKSRCSREDSASYISFSSLLNGDCVGMPALVISPGIASARFAMSRECSLHIMARLTFENQLLRSLPVIPFLPVLRKVGPWDTQKQNHKKKKRFVMNITLGPT